MKLEETGEVALPWSVDELLEGTVGVLFYENAIYCVQ
jgi:hypothetical protein